MINASYFKTYEGIKGEEEDCFLSGRLAGGLVLVGLKIKRNSYFVDESGHTVEPLLRGHPDERPAPLERPLDNVNLNINVLISTPNERPPLLKGHLPYAKGVDSQEGLHCMLLYNDSTVNTHIFLISVVICHQSCKAYKITVSFCLFA